MSRAGDVPEATYREAVTAFHTALAALETSQEPLARQKLDRVVALVPQEPAGWANLGLLLLRQQENGPAKERLTKAAELAPQNAAIERLLAIAESRAGNSAESIRHWRRALELAPADVKAAYALAQEVERQGTPESDAEAQRALETLLATSDNLPARLDAIRLAAKRGDAAAVNKGLDVLAPPRAVVAGAGAGAARRAAPGGRHQPARRRDPRPVPEERPRARAGLPPRPRAGLDAARRRRRADRAVPRPAEPAAGRRAAPDTALQVSATPTVGAAADATWAGVIVANAEAAPAVADAGAGGVRIGGQPIAALHAKVAAPLGPDAVLAADLDYDFRTDLVVASGAGVVFLRQGADGGFTDVTKATTLPASIAGAPARAVWAADVDTDGDLDVVLAPATRRAPRCCATTATAPSSRSSPFAGVPGVRGFAWADLDGEGVPDAAFLDDAGRVHVQLNLRGGAFQRGRGAPRRPGRRHRRASKPPATPPSIW